MTKSDLIVIGKLVNSLVKKEIDPLLKEVKTLNSNVNKLLTESKQDASRFKPSTPSVDHKVNNFSQKQQSNSPLFSILSEVQPFNEETEDGTESILDTLDNVVVENNDPVSKVLHKLQTTDFRKTLEIMERASSNSNALGNR